MPTIVKIAGYLEQVRFARKSSKFLENQGLVVAQGFVAKRLARFQQPLHPRP